MDDLEQGHKPEQAQGPEDGQSQDYELVKISKAPRVRQILKNQKSSFLRFVRFARFAVPISSFADEFERDRHCRT